MSSYGNNKREVEDVVAELMHIIQNKETKAAGITTRRAKIFIASKSLI